MNTVKHTVLVVDDDPDIVGFLSLLLSMDGYEVCSVDRGRDALVRARDGVDLVLLDLSMTDMGGLEVCRRLKDDPSTASLPVLVVSARAADEDRASALAVGADGFVVKPFSNEDLLRTVRAHVTARR